MKPVDFLNWRKALRYSQAEAAEKLGVTRTTIQNWERGATRSWGSSSVLSLPAKNAWTLESIRKSKNEGWVVDVWEFKKWRKTLKYSQVEAAGKLGVVRGTIRSWENELRPIPCAIELACIELTRRWKHRPEFGPVILVYVGDWLVQQSYGPDCIGLLQREPYPTNDAAIQQVCRLRQAPNLLDPLAMVIMESDGEIIWTGPEILRECRKRGRMENLMHLKQQALPAHIAVVKSDANGSGTAAEPRKTPSPGFAEVASSQPPSRRRRSRGPETRSWPNRS
jgi:DNA-binding XRE family transcriptional regulator